MQDKTSTVNQLSGSIGLRIHPGKSKMLRIKTEDTQAITVGGKSLEVVEKFMYLGRVIDHSGGTAAAVRAQISFSRERILARLASCRRRLACPGLKLSTMAPWTWVASCSS
ncbi:hypothetical protein RRG08_051137 [Elysia crispata]|uniref:Uncharacterized protein n=1 Tax=Elysia crispata TaxID=231223 RepID=A0AAE1B7A9_9GAST|nr:hypothetical protein RRG08_051137 [Elysia crispata]